MDFPFYMKTDGTQGRTEDVYCLISSLDLDMTLWDYRWLHLGFVQKHKFLLSHSSFHLHRR